MWLCIGAFCCVTLMVGRFIESKVETTLVLAIGFAGMGLSLFGCLEVPPLLVL